MIYPDLESARRPLPHSEEVTVPTYCSTSESSQEPNPSQENNKVNSDSDFEGSNFTEPKPFTQKELNDLIRDLELSKESAEVLASRLKEKNLLTTGTKEAVNDITTIQNEEDRPQDRSLRYTPVYRPRTRGLSGSITFAGHLDKLRTIRKRRSGDRPINDSCYNCKSTRNSHHQHLK
ncbi:hypothetical protein PYW08_013040 [Mythimna loreyi]|uniref:Uncharacterized protein n=1 Tax=Mythimna loreyi TaxID=667449 RepID=A0ACC2PZ69_9NEOP|nr:hypothetical protein PYW08_013040 [Mythimna loreyi]